MEIHIDIEQTTRLDLNTKTILINKNTYNFIQLHQEESKGKQMKRENKIKNIDSEIKSFQKSLSSWP